MKKEKPKSDKMNKAKDPAAKSVASKKKEIAAVPEEPKEKEKAAKSEKPVQEEPKVKKNKAGKGEEVPPAAKKEKAAKPEKPVQEEPKVKKGKTGKGVKEVEPAAKKEKGGEDKSTKFLVSMKKSIRKAVKKDAAESGVSMNDYIVAAVEAKLALPAAKVKKNPKK